MIRTGNYTQVTDYYKNNAVSKQSGADKSKETQNTEAKIKSSEDKLS